MSTPTRSELIQRILDAYNLQGGKRASTERELKALTDGELQTVATDDIRDPCIGRGNGKDFLHDSKSWDDPFADEPAQPGEDEEKPDLSAPGLLVDGLVNPKDWHRPWPFASEVIFDAILSLGQDSEEFAEAVQYELARSRHDAGKYPRFYYHETPTNRSLKWERDPLIDLCTDAHNFPDAYAHWRHPRDFSPTVKPWSLLTSGQRSDWFKNRRFNPSPCKPPLLDPSEVQGGFTQLAELIDSVAIADLNNRPAGDPYLRLRVIRDWCDRVTQGRWMPLNEFIAGQDITVKGAFSNDVEHPHAMLLRLPHSVTRQQFLKGVDKLIRQIPEDKFWPGSPGQSLKPRDILRSLCVARIWEEGWSDRAARIRTAVYVLQRQNLHPWKKKVDDADLAADPKAVQGFGKILFEDRKRMSALLDNHPDLKDRMNCKK